MSIIAKCKICGKTYTDRAKPNPGKNGKTANPPESEPERADRIGIILASHIKDKHPAVWQEAIEHGKREAAFDAICCFDLPEDSFLCAYREAGRRVLAGYHARYFPDHPLDYDGILQIVDAMEIPEEFREKVAASYMLLISAIQGIIPGAPDVQEKLAHAIQNQAEVVGR
jgi:hypothetical protein